MLCLGKSMLLFLAALLFLIGAILVCRSFRANSKEVLSGALGVIALLFAGNIVIYLYSQLPVPKRVIEEFHPEELCFRSDNYISRRDFVTRLDIMGRLKYGSELHILEPHPNAKFWDHEFASSTFAETIKRHIKEYIEEYGGRE